MDFSFNEDQLAIRDLAARVFADRATTERVREVERGDGIDRSLWAELARTGLIGIALPESAGGAGLGFVELCLILEQQGRHAAPVPLWPTTCAALAVAAAGPPAQSDPLLSAVANGSQLMTVGLEEFGGADPLAPATAAIPHGDGWLLSGTKAAVPVAQAADRVVISAHTDCGAGLFLLDPQTPGAVLQRVDTTSHEPAAHLVLDRAAADLLGHADGSTLAWLVDRVQVARAALLLGVAESALTRTAAYVSERKQFGRALGTFQAVQHQVADCYIDVDAMRVTLWQAAWLFDHGADPGTAVLVAAWWAGDAGARVVHRVQHLHGGIGVDVDYPIHRFLLWGKQLAGLLGGPSADLARLGDRIAVSR